MGEGKAIIIFLDINQFLFLLGPIEDLFPRFILHAGSRFTVVCIN